MYKRFDVEYKFKISRSKYLFLWCLFLTKKSVQNGVYRNSFFFTVVLIKNVSGRSILHYSSVGFTIVFALATGIIKKLLKATKNEKKKHDKILMWAKNKLNSIESLVSQALTDMEISHKEFTTILKEKDKYEKMKENVRNISEKLEEEEEEETENM